MLEVLVVLSNYRELFLLGFELLVMYVCITFMTFMFKRVKEGYVEANADENRMKLNINFHGDINEVERQNAIRQLIAPDGIDPNPNSYIGISDGGREYYVRSVTLSKMPKKVEYAETLKNLLAYPGCFSTVFVEPIDSEVMGKKIDKQIDNLETERHVSQGETNRQRKLLGQEREITEWADDLENGDKNFFNVGFLFTFVSDDVEKLNRITDDFRSLALNKKMDISNCYGVQSEAFLSNAPLNRKAKILFGKIDSDCVMMHQMDECAVSVVLNYTTDYHSHKTGVPLGRHIYTGLPYLFDLYDSSHYGYTMIVAGKTRSGKTAAIQMMMNRNIPLGYRYVVIDSQTKKGTSEGEYAATTQMNGGMHFQISSRNSNILNIFEVQESVEWVKDGAIDSGYERRTLDLNGAINEIICTLRSLMQIGVEDDGSKMDRVMDSDINAILNRVVKELFAERGIVHDDADSLYEESDIVRGGVLQSGIVPKKLPIVSDCMKKIMLERFHNTDSALDDAYRFIENNLKENVRELYYTEESCTFFTKKEYDEIAPDMNGVKYYKNGNSLEKIIAFYGTRPYFDGQSSYVFSKDCPCVDFDISQLSETERIVARIILTRYMIEQFIKKNSEVLGSADKIVGIIDEAHENFKYSYCREMYESAVRTAAKRFAGLIFATQTIKEFDQYKETRIIMTQASVKMVFKQDEQDREDLIRILNITDSQASIITNVLGAVKDTDDPEAGRKHKGEACVIDGDQVSFIKVDYLVETEQLAVEADVSSIIKNMRKAG